MNIKQEVVEGGTIKEFVNLDTRKSLRFFDNESLLFASVQEKGELVLGMQYVKKIDELELFGSLGDALKKMNIPRKEKIGRGLAYVHEVVKEQERYEKDLEAQQKSNPSSGLKL